MQSTEVLGLFLFSFLSLGCAIDIDFQDKTQQSALLDFEDVDNFDFDNSYIELKNGKIQLKALNLEQRKDDFTQGSHVGTQLYGSSTTLAHTGSGLEPLDRNLMEAMSSKNGALKGYWRFSGNLEDSSGNDNQGVGHGGHSFGNGNNGQNQFLKLDGSTGYVDVGSDSSLDFGSGDLTLSLWFRVSETSPIGVHKIFVKGGDQSGGKRVEVALVSGFADDGHLFIFLDDDTVKYTVKSTENTYRDGQWHHVIGILDKTNDELRMIVDGVMSPAAPTDLTGMLSLDSARPGLIGASTIESDGSVVGHTNGAIDEVALWNTAFSDQEAFQLHRSQNLIHSEETSLSPDWTPDYSDILAYWKMDGNWKDSSGHGLDLRGHINASFDELSAVGPMSSNMLVSDAYAFIDDPSDQSLDPKSLSMALWIRPDASESSGNLVCKNSAYRLSFGANNSIRFYGYLNGSSISVDEAAPYDQWTHVVATGSPKGTKIYVNGVLRVETPVPYDWRDGGRLYVGICGVGGVFAGFMDDLSIWKTSLQPTEIKLMYERQKQKYAGSYSSAVVDLGSLTTSWASLSWSTNLPFGKELVGDLSGGGSLGNENVADYTDFLELPFGDLVGYWDLNERTTGTAIGKDFLDRSATGGSGEVFGNPILGVKGILGQAATFDGSGDYILTSDLGDVGSTIGSKGLSYSFWFKTTEKVVAHAPFGFFNTGINTALSPLFNKKIDGVDEPGICRYFLRGEGNVTSSGHFDCAAFQDGAWHHWATVHDPQLALSKIYLDGKQQVLTASFSSFGSYANLEAPLVIGGTNSRGTPNGTFRGSLDEISIWSTPLSNEQVQQLYRRGANRVKFQVKSCVDLSCNCKSFKTSPAGTIDDCDGDGITNSEDRDDSHQAEFKGPGGDGTTDFSEIFNRKPEDILFDCDANITDSSNIVCAEDEILFSGTSELTSPLFSFDTLLESAKPIPNRYFQYRVQMEADENEACDGEPCLPEFSSVDLNAGGELRYFGQPQIVKTKQPISYTHIRSARLEAESCARFHLSPDGTQFYTWSEGAWRPSEEAQDGISATILTANIPAFSEEFGPGDLYLQAHLSTDGVTPCSFGNFQVETSELTAK